MVGVTTVETCKAACVETGYVCEAIIFHAAESKCYRKGAITLGLCPSDAPYDLYLRTDPKPPLPPSTPSPPADARFLTSSTCSRMMRDKNHKFFTMWSGQGWGTRSFGQSACWDNAGFFGADSFFRDAHVGTKCGENWDEQNGRGLFDAPAVFGMAESMEEYCNQHGGSGDLRTACRQANLNILRIGGWNMCVNMQWMFCAADGKLHGQGSSNYIIFSIAPKNLDTYLLERKVQPPSVQGWNCCGTYAENDIYYLEVCTLNEVCSNTDELFALNEGDPFYCQFDTSKYTEMQRVLRQWD